MWTMYTVLKMALHHREKRITVVSERVKRINNAFQFFTRLTLSETTDTMHGFSHTLYSIQHNYILYLVLYTSTLWNHIGMVN